jgi:hypothetical protein
MDSSLQDLGLVLASSVNFSCAFLLAFFWKINLGIYSLIVFVFSFVLGAVLTDIKKSIIYVYISMVVGLVIAVVAVLTPHLLFTSRTEMEFAAIAVFTVLGKVILVSIIIYFLGALFGVALGEKFERTS